MSRKEWPTVHVLALWRMRAGLVRVRVRIRIRVRVRVGVGVGVGVSDISYCAPVLEEEGVHPRVLRVPRVLGHLVRVGVRVGVGVRIGLRVPRVLAHLGRPSEDEECSDRPAEGSEPAALTWPLWLRVDLD